MRPTRIASAPAALPCDELLANAATVARALIDGATIPAIAATLGCGHDSVKAHVREIHQRLGVTSRTELVALTRPETLPFGEWFRCWAPR